MKDYEAVLALAPRNPRALNNLAWLMLAGNSDKAVELAERALSVAPDDANVHDTVGWALVESGQIQRGIVFLRRALQGRPKDREIATRLTVALERSGDIVGAREISEKYRSGG